mmetsp:Transcript_6203/g.14836  ORF Transcript_6203/g.14836 Transcript_6203/m.14836 type:complete len:339 (-) Transcript_6203:86-1102(-)
MAAKEGDAATKRVDKRPETPTARFVAKCRMFCNKKLYEGLVYVALYDGALVVLPNGHLMDQAVDIKGATAYIQGLGVAVWVGTESVARLWLEDAADVDKFAAAFTASVAVEKSCVGALRMLMRAQRRSECWRGCAERMAHRLQRFQAAICGTPTSATGIWQDWYQPATGQKRPKEKVSGTFQDEQLQGYLGTIGFYHKSLGRHRTTCSVSLHGDVLVAVPLDRCTKSVSVILHGTTINLASKMVGIWRDSVLVGRLWFQNDSDAARWMGLLDCATRLLADAVPATEYGKKRAVTILPPPKPVAQGPAGDTKRPQTAGMPGGSLRVRAYVNNPEAASGA